MLADVETARWMHVSYKWLPNHFLNPVNPMSIGSLR